MAEKRNSTPPKKCLGLAIKRIRLGRKMSQTDLRKKTGIENGYISRIENGWVIPSYETLEKLAAGLGVTVAQIKLLEIAECEPNLTRDYVDSLRRLIPESGTF